MIEASLASSPASAEQSIDVLSGLNRWLMMVEEFANFRPFPTKHQRDPLWRYIRRKHEREPTSPLPFCCRHVITPHGRVCPLLDGTPPRRCDRVPRPSWTSVEVQVGRELPGRVHLCECEAIAIDVHRVTKSADISESNQLEHSFVVCRMYNIIPTENVRLESWIVVQRNVDASSQSNLSPLPEPIP